MNLDSIEINAPLVGLVYEALLKSFWRKQALKTFLLNSGISQVILSSWSDESKREFLDRLFNALSKHSQKKQIILRITDNLIGQKTFPDLRGWEDEELKIQQAHKAVSDLKKYVDIKLTEKLDQLDKQRTRENINKINEQIRKFETDREALQAHLFQINNDLGSQKGGYDFETWFYKMLDYAEITNRRPYKIDGRQIDGSLTLDGTTYLVELKFTKNQTGSEDIDSFKAKVDKMADNTMGIFVSMSGYSSQAIKEASVRKTTMILLEASHLLLFLQGVLSFDDILRRCRRHVSQTAEALLTVDKLY